MQPSTHPQCPSGSRVAIVGSGIAGLTAAWLLARRFDVSLFEASARPGGHTHTRPLQIDGRTVALDTGFIVYNDRNYPCFTRLLESLGVAGTPTDMSFSVTSAAAGIEYNGGSFAGLFAGRGNLARADFWRMLRDVLRFNRYAPRLLELHGTGPSLGRHLADARYSRAFVDNYLLPMSAAIWSVPTNAVQTFPAKQIIAFFRNHGLLSLDDRPQWSVVRDGSDTYVRALLRGLPHPPRLATAVRGVRRTATGVLVRTDAGTEPFDAIVLACHSDQALAVLEDPDPAERAVLGAIRYQTNDVALHTDITVMPQARAAWASWNYRVSATDPGAATVTYWMNRLQRISTPTPLLVTLNQTDALDPARVLERVEYTHPVFDAPAVAAQARRAEISGARRTWYCGAYWGYGFHEDGCRSAVDVARAMGIDW